MREDRIMGSIRSSRGGGRRSVSINNNVDIVIFLKIEMRTGVSFTVNASSSLINKTLDEAEKLKMQLVRGVKFHGFFSVIPNRDRSFQRVSKTHSYASSIPEFLRAHALNIRTVLRLVTHYV